jgi:hypothetical protein
MDSSTNASVGRNLEARGDGLVGGSKRVGVHAQGHRRVGVAESTGDRADIVTLPDRDGGRPVTEIV